MLPLSREPLDWKTSTQYQCDRRQSSLWYACKVVEDLDPLKKSLQVQTCLTFEKGGYPKFVSQGHNDNFLPVWLQSAGYDTYYTGKLFNAHTVDNYDKPFVNGFNGSDFLLDPYTYQYLNSAYQRNHDPPVSYKGRHTTDVISEKALGFLDDALSGDRPFFLAIAPVAPHSNVGVPDNSSFEDLGKLFMSSPIPLERHKHLFENVTVPRTENFNPDSVRLPGCTITCNILILSILSSQAVSIGSASYPNKTSLTSTTMITFIARD